MPKKSAAPSLAEQHAAPGGAAAVDRAMTVLASFRPGEPAASVTELAQRTGLYKSTVLRLLASLEHAGLVRRHDGGGWSLGPAVPRLHAVYLSSFSLESVVMPVLRELVAATRESAAFHVRQGAQRLCLYRVDSDQALRDHTRAGDLLPLDRGAGGRVLTAFGGAPGAVHERIRRAGYAVVSGDRVPELAGISAPAFDAGGALAGAVTLTMPVSRLQAEAQVPQVVGAARRIGERLGFVGASSPGAGGAA